MEDECFDGVSRRFEIISASGLYFLANYAAVNKPSSFQMGAFSFTLFAIFRPHIIISFT